MQGEELEAIPQKEFFNELISFIEKQNLCDRLIQSHPCGIVKAVPEHAVSCAFGTYINDLAHQTDEDIYKNLNEKYRQAVGAAAKGGAVIKYGKEVLNDFYILYSNTMKKAGISAESFDYFESLYKYLGSSSVETAVVYDKDQPIGSLLAMYSNYAAFVTHAGSGGNSKLYGAVKFLHYEMMKAMKARGVKRYDLVGVRLGKIPPALEGVFRFKKGFGGELKEGFLWKKDVHPGKIKVYDLLMRLRGTKSADIIDQSL
jgi:lipid II:glycine glycyltransferase (peptidoglycan interpeptide bridge formation enzyme)